MMLYWIIEIYVFTITERDSFKRDTQTHPHTHPHTHTHTHTPTHPHTHPPTHTHTPPHTHTPTHTPPSHTHTHTHTHIYELVSYMDNLNDGTVVDSGRNSTLYSTLTAMAVLAVLY